MHKALLGKENRMEGDFQTSPPSHSNQITVGKPLFGLLTGPRTDEPLDPPVYTTSKNQPSRACGWIAIGVIVLMVALWVAYGYLTYN